MKCFILKFGHFLRFYRIEREFSLRFSHENQTISYICIYVHCAYLSAVLESKRDCTFSTPHYKHHHIKANWICDLSCDFPRGISFLMKGKYLWSGETMMTSKKEFMRYNFGICLQLTLSRLLFISNNCVFWVSRNVKDIISSIQWWCEGGELFRRDINHKIKTNWSWTTDTSRLRFTARFVYLDDDGILPLSLQYECWCSCIYSWFN